MLGRRGVTTVPGRGIRYYLGSTAAYHVPEFIINEWAKTFNEETKKFLLDNARGKTAS